MKKRWFLLIAAIAVSAAGIYNWRAYILLPWIENKLEHQFNVEQLAPDSLASLLDSERLDLVLLDTRTNDEFNTSRIEGALRVPWDMDAQQFKIKYGMMVRDRELVFYCSVGYRSSAMIQRLGKSLENMGAKRAVNLRGGIFTWYNQGWEVVDSSGAATDDIHPYDQSWGHLVKRR